MALADMALGANTAIKQILLQRLQAQQYADTLKQRDFENQRQVAADARAQQQLDLQAESTRLLRERQQAEADDLKQQRTYAEANALGDQLPAGTFLPEGDAAVTTLQRGGRGGLLTAKDAGMGTAFQGPLPTGETPQSVAHTRPKGYLKTASAKQQQDAATRQDKLDDNARQDKRDAQAAAYQAGMLRVAQENATNKANTNAPADELTHLRVEAERAKQQQAATDQANKEKNARESTQLALDLVGRLGQHPGFERAYGNVASYLAPFSQEATDAGAIRDQLVAALTLPNLGALKGSMSDKDILFIKSVSTRLANPRISQAEARKALSEASTFLRGKLGGDADGGTVDMVAPDGRALKVPAEKVADLEAHGARRR